MEDSSIKVLYLCPNGYLGGAERAVIDFCRGHLGTKVKATLYFFNEGVAKEKAKEYGIDTVLNPIPFKLTSFFKLFKALIFLRRFVKENNYSIIHSTMPYAHIVGFLATIFLPIKRVWYQHGPVGGVLDKLAMKLPVDQIYFNSTYLQAVHNLDYLFSIPLKKEFIVPYGINFKDANKTNVQKIRGTYLKDGEKLILQAGRICEWKGYELLINALLNLKNENKEINAKILIVGSAMRESDKNYEKKIHSLVKQHHLENQIHFLSFADNLEDYYAAADFFIHTSTIPEPFGLVVAEAMLHECLVIGSSKGGVTDILQHEKTGLSFDTTAPNAVEQLEDILEKIFINSFYSEQRLCEHIAEGVNLISKNYTINKVANTFQKSYQELIAQ